MGTWNNVAGPETRPAGLVVTDALVNTRSTSLIQLPGVVSSSTETLQPMQRTPKRRSSIWMLPCLPIAAPRP